jgi:hypothetical protein
MASIANDTKEPAKVVKVGYLTKLGRKDGLLGKSWKMRYFVLLQFNKKALLYYYLDENSYKTKKKERGCVDLLAASVIQKLPEYANKKFAFEVSTPSRTLLLHAENKKEKLQWVRQIAETAEIVTERFVHQRHVHHNKINTRSLSVTTKKLVHDFRNLSTDSEQSETSKKPVQDFRNLSTDSEQSETSKKSVHDFQQKNCEESEGTEGTEEIGCDGEQKCLVSNTMKQKQEEEKKRIEAAVAVAAIAAAAKENEQKEQERLRRELEEAKKAIDKAKQEEVEAAERARIQALEEKEVKVAAATAAVKEAAEKAKEEAETARASIERARVEALKQSLLKKAHNGFICMKKLKTEVKFRSPRYVWCDNGEIRWSKGREKNEKKGHYKSMLASDVISIIPAENEIEDEKNKKNIKKKKRGSIFAGALDSSELVETITEEAVLYVVSRKGDHFTLALHLSPTASKSSLQGAVAKRRNELVEILRAFVNDNVENSGSNGSNRETKE